MTGTMLDEHDSSSISRKRPDFTAIIMYGGMLIMKGEARYAC